eukprot:68677_1
MEFNFVNVSRGRHDYPRQSIIGYAIDTYGVAGDVHIGSIANNEYLNFYNPGNNDCWSSARVNFYNSTMNFGKIKFSANFRGLYIRNFTWIFAEPATSEPTIYPSIMPSSDPTTSPTRSYKTKIVNGSYICGDLTASKYVEYDVTFEECVNMHCGDNVNDCAMVNYIPNSKSSTDSRCYVFDKQCEIVHDISIDNNFITLIAFKGFKSICMDFPTDWNDKLGDSCVYYSNQRWCENGNIAHNLSVSYFAFYTDWNYKLNAMEACCVCGGGLEIIDSVRIGFDIYTGALNTTSWSDKRSDSTDHITHKQWNRYNLFQLCMELKRKTKHSFAFKSHNDKLTNIHNYIDCNSLITKVNVDTDNHLIFCSNNNTQNSTDAYLWNFIMIISSHEVTNAYTIYINDRWFNDTQITMFNSMKLSYSECVSELTKIYMSYTILAYSIDIYDIQTNHTTTKKPISFTFTTSINETSTMETISIAHIESDSMDIMFIIFVVSFILLVFILIGIIAWNVKLKKLIKQQQTEYERVQVGEREFSENNNQNNVENNLDGIANSEIQNENGVANWSQDDIVEWMNNINLTDKWKQIALNAVKNGEFDGGDMINIKSGKDVSTVFGIKNPMLCSRLWRELKKTKQS